METGTDSDIISTPVLPHFLPFQKLTRARLVHGPTDGPLVLMGVVALDAGQVGHAVVPAHHEYEAEHDADAEVDPLVCHGGYHFPGVLAGVVPLHAVRGGNSRITKNPKQRGRTVVIKCNENNKLYQCKNQKLAVAVDDWAQ